MKTHKNLSQSVIHRQQRNRNSVRIVSSAQQCTNVCTVRERAITFAVRLPLDYYNESMRQWKAKESVWRLKTVAGKGNKYTQCTAQYLLHIFWQKVSKGEQWRKRRRTNRRNKERERETVCSIPLSSNMGDHNCSYIRVKVSESDHKSE